MLSESSTTDLLLENEKCLVLEIVDLKDGQLCEENLGQLLNKITAEELLMGAVPKRNSNVSAVPKRKSSMKIEDGIDTMWNSGETANVTKSLGLGVIGVTSVVDCVTNIYLRSTKLPRTSEREMETDGVTVSVGECKGAVLGLRPGYEPEQTCDAGLSLATNVRGARCKSVMETMSCGDYDGTVIGTELRCAHMGYVTRSRDIWRLM